MAVLKASIISWNEIEVVSTSYSKPPRFDLFVGNEVVLYNLYKIEKNRFIYSFNYQKEILGNRFYLKTSDKEITIDVTQMVNFEKFDYHYTYEGNDLGPTYNKSYTKFVLWAPLASQVILRIKDQEFELKRYG